LAEARLESSVARRWGVPESQLDAAALARGFTSYRELIETARLAYVYEHLA
jgi:hypothetical protein